jgi:hypothetical protein
MRFRPIAVLIVLSACGSSAKKTNPGDPPAHPNVANVSLSEVGLEAASLDKAADPCSDFFQYTCGGWLAANEIPADKARYARFTEIDDRNDKAVRVILDELAANPGDDPVKRKLGDYYASCLDQPAIEKTGLKGQAPLLDAIAGVKNVASLQAAIATLHRHGVAAVWGLGVEADVADSTTNIVYLDTDGLGLPDRDFYFKDDFESARKAYRAHLGRLFGLLGKGKGELADRLDRPGASRRLAGVLHGAGQRRAWENRGHDSCFCGRIVGGASRGQCRNLARVSDCPRDQRRCARIAQGVR